MKAKKSEGNKRFVNHLGIKLQKRKEKRKQKRRPKNQLLEDLNAQQSKITGSKNRNFGVKKSKSKFTKIKNGKMNVESKNYDGLQNDSQETGGFKISSSNSDRMAKLQEFVNQEVGKVGKSSNLAMSPTKQLSRNDKKANLIKNKAKLLSIQRDQEDDTKEMNRMARLLNLRPEQKKKVAPVFADDFGDILADIEEGSMNRASGYSDREMCKANIQSDSDSESEDSDSENALGNVNGKNKGNVRRYHTNEDGGSMEDQVCYSETEEFSKEGSDDGQGLGDCEYEEISHKENGGPEFSEVEEPDDESDGGLAEFSEVEEPDDESDGGQAEFSEVEEPDDESDDGQDYGDCEFEEVTNRENGQQELVDSEDGDPSDDESDDGQDLDDSETEDLMDEEEEEARDSQGFFDSEAEECSEEESNDDKELVHDDTNEYELAFEGGSHYSSKPEILNNGMVNDIDNYSSNSDDDTDLENFVVDDDQVEYESTDGELPDELDQSLSPPKKKRKRRRVICNDDDGDDDDDDDDEDHSTEVGAEAESRSAGKRKLNKRTIVSDSEKDSNCSSPPKRKKKRCKVITDDEESGIEDITQKKSKLKKKSNNSAVTTDSESNSNYCNSPQKLKKKQQHVISSDGGDVDADKSDNSAIATDSENNSNYSPSPQKGKKKKQHVVSSDGDGGVDAEKSKNSIIATACENNSNYSSPRKVKKKKQQQLVISSDGDGGDIDAGKSDNSALATDSENNINYSSSPQKRKKKKPVILGDGGGDAEKSKNSIIAMASENSSDYSSPQNVKKKKQQQHVISSDGGNGDVDAEKLNNSVIAADSENNSNYSPSPQKVKKKKPHVISSDGDGGDVDAEKSKNSIIATASENSSNYSPPQKVKKKKKKQHVISSDGGDVDAEKSSNLVIATDSENNSNLVITTASENSSNYSPPQKVKKKKKKKHVISSDGGDVDAEKSSNLVITTDSENNSNLVITTDSENNSNLVIATDSENNSNYSSPQRVKKKKKKKKHVISSDGGGGGDAEKSNNLVIATDSENNSDYSPSPQKVKKKKKQVILNESGDGDFDAEIQIKTKSEVKADNLEEEKEKFNFDVDMNEQLPSKKKAKRKKENTGVSDINSSELSEKEDHLNSPDTVDDVREDIYGRLRDKEGNVLKDKDQTVSGKYIPPALRKLMAMNIDEKKKEMLARLKRNLKGLLNRLAESNVAGIASQIEGLFQKHSHNDMNDCLSQLFFESLVAPTLTPERLVQEHAMLMAVLSANIGNQVGAHMLTEFVFKFYDDMQDNVSSAEVNCKSKDNMLLFIANLFNFKLVNARLIYDILQRLADVFTEKEVELILMVLRTVGFSLRKDDPLALKTFITQIQSQAATHQAKSSDNYSRICFMLEIIHSIKNNNPSKVPNYDPSHAEHLKKVMKGLIHKGKNVSPLYVTLDDILNSQSQGRWWLVGSAWSGGLKENRLPSSVEVVEPKKTSCMEDEFSEHFKKRAAKLQLTRPPRINIMYIITEGSEDYLDAFDKLLQLKLPTNQEQEMFNVILLCCQKGKVYNEFFSHLACRLCKFNKKYKRLLQFSIWDKFEEIENYKPNEVNNLAKFLVHLIGEDGLSITVLKNLSFVDADAQMITFVKTILKDLLLHPSGSDRVLQIFAKISAQPELRFFCQSLKVFITKFIISKKKKDKPKYQVLYSRSQDVLELISMRGGVAL